MREDKKIGAWGDARGQENKQGLGANISFYLMLLKRTDAASRDVACRVS